MSKVFIPAGYHSCLSLYDTQKAISLIKRVFEDTLCGNLNLSRVSAPLFVEASTGLNDDLNGVERPVSFDVPDIGRDAQVVHSLAKWMKRWITFTPSMWTSGIGKRLSRQRSVMWPI